MKKIIATCVALTAIGLFHSDTARADHRRGFSMRFGSGGVQFGISTRGFRGDRGYGRSYGISRYSCQPRIWYQDTSRWDYRQPTFYRHMNPYHRQPGGLYYYRMGGWRY